MSFAFDEALAPMRQFIESMAVAIDALAAPEASVDLGMPAAFGSAGFHVASMEIDLPFELQIEVAQDGSLGLGGGPPTQYTETTVLPVFHRLKLFVEAQR